MNRGGTKTRGFKIMRGFSGLFRRSGIAAAGFGLMACLSPQGVLAQFYYQRPVGVLPPQAISEIANEELGLRSVSRLLRSGEVYYVEGVTPRGAQMRFVVDAYYGRVLQRTVLRAPVRGDVAERRRLAGIGRSDYPGHPGSMDRFDDGEPEDFPGLRPPGRIKDGAQNPTPPQKTASALTRPPVAPAKPLPTTPAALPEKTAPKASAKPAAAPATSPAVAPPSRPLPSAAKITPDAPGPRLQNPDDLRLPAEPDRAPPMAARANERLVPAMLDDATPKSTRPPTAPVPVTPLN
jgi:hypothetical protein